MPKPIARKDLLALTEDQNSGLNVLANDTDPDGDPLTVIAIDASRSKGGVSLFPFPEGIILYNARGEFEFLGQDQATTDKFTYTISDGSDGTAKGKVAVTITGRNDTPVAADDARATSENKPIKINVLANDHDVDRGDALTVSAVDDTGTAGEVALRGNGRIRYDPNGQFDHLAPGETDTDSFSYTVSDENGLGPVGSVTVTLRGKNDRPTDIALDNLTVDEEDRGAVIGTLTVTDPDTSDTHTFQVSGGQGFFEVEGNTLKLQDGFAADFGDFDYGGPFLVNITAIDPANARIRETFTIVVNDVNEAAPLSAVLEQASLDGSTDTLV